MAQIKVQGAQFAFLNQGAIIQELSIAGHNIVLSFPSSKPYLNAPYFGETIGRVANRIPGGKINDLNGRAYQLNTNERSLNHLHGGTDGWGHKHFSGPSSVVRHGKDALCYTYTSPDGDEGYPGTVEVRVFYAGYEVVEEGISKQVLDIEYEAELIGDECNETVINVTNHSYFNLGDGPTIEGTQLSLSTIQHLVVDVNAIPTGEIRPFGGLEADKSFVLGAKEPSIDHCFVVDDGVIDPSIDTRAHEVRTMVRAFHPSTRIHLDVYSTEPSFQLYTGDFIDVAALDASPARAPRAGLCIEPGRFINAVNVPAWRPQVLLSRGQTYGSKILYKLWQE